MGKEDSEKPLKNRTRQFVTFFLVAAAIVGFVAWYKINQDYLGEFFSTFRDFYRYVSFHLK